MLQSILETIILSHFILELELEFLNIILRLFFQEINFIKTIILLLDSLLKNILVLNTTGISF